MRIVVIGYGSIAKKHIDAFNNLEYQPDIFALRSARPSEKLEGITNIYNFEDIKQLNPDFIIISNPTSAHYETIKKVSEYSIPLFIEKPLFSSLGQDEEQLVNKINDTGIINYVACNLRFLDSIKKIKEIITEEKINEVNAYSGSYLPDWRPGADFRKTYSACRELGGGVHIDLIHELDYLYWLFGSPHKTSSFFSNTSTLMITAFDYANYLWMYENFSAGIVLNYYRKIPKRSLEIITEKNIYEINLLDNTVRKNGSIIFSSEQRIKDTYPEQMRFFITNILQSKEKFNTVTDAYKILKLCLEKA